jgi:alanine racemase
VTPTHASAWIEVDLDALVNNARVLRSVLAPGVALGVLVKANGYGHGLEMSARAALTGGADALVVATLDEGLALRAAGLAGRILVVYPVPRHGVGDAAAANLEPTVSGVASARDTLAGWAAARAASGGRRLRLHVEIDSGMGRGGIPPSGLGALLREVDAADGVELAGLWSHLADGRDDTRSREQARRFAAAVETATNGGRRAPMCHLVASEGLLAETAPPHDMVRIGLAFYGEVGLGFTPSPGMAKVVAALRPALALKARPVRIETLASGDAVGYGGEWVADRRSTVATLPIGYADGWARSSWPGASALVGGARAPLIGRVSMDSVCVDITGIEGVTLDDEVVLLGAQGDARITVNEIAELRGTIPNEVLSTLGSRLPRHYLEDGSLVSIGTRPEHVQRGLRSTG